MYKRPLADLRYIIIHHSVTPQDWTIKDIREIHLGMGYSDIGYHFVRESAGLRVGRPVLYVGAHALTEKDPYRIRGISMNYSAIGFCIIGDFSNSPPSDELINDCSYDIKRICEKYIGAVSRKIILPHYSVSYTACPGKDTIDLIYKKLRI